MPAIAEMIAGMARSYGRSIVIIKFTHDVLEMPSCVNFQNYCVWVAVSLGVDMTISTRRFCWRPAALSLLATGRLSP